MAEAALTPAERERIRAIVRAHLHACLQELDRLGLWSAGAHLASAIEAIDREEGRPPAAAAGAGEPSAALKSGSPLSETRQ
jgi:hypothetical protein